MLHELPDGSVADENGRIVHFSVERFVREIGQGDKCFICGSGRATTPFNDEHVLPDWILRQYAIHSTSVIVPNATPLRLGQYKLACCADCNAVMGAKFEGPIRNLLQNNYIDVVARLSNGEFGRIFQWLALIFLKSHLKDKDLRQNRDLRAEDKRIADTYAWEDFHHVHCIARSFYSLAFFGFGVFGTLCVLPAKVFEKQPAFDFCTLREEKAILLRVGETCFIAVFDDAQGAGECFGKYLSAMNKPMLSTQLREILGRLGYYNRQFMVRPRFRYEIHPDGNAFAILAEVPPKLQLRRRDPELLGRVLLTCFTSEVLSRAKTGDPEGMLRAIGSGKYTSLFDSDIKFLDGPDPVWGGLQLGNMAESPDCPTPEDGFTVPAYPSLLVAGLPELYANKTLSA